MVIRIEKIVNEFPILCSESFRKKLLKDLNEFYKNNKCIKTEDVIKLANLSNISDQSLSLIKKKIDIILL